MTQQIINYPILIHQKICSLEIPMYDVVLMQIIHPFTNIDRYFEQKWKSNRSLLCMQILIQTSSKHVFWWKRTSLMCSSCCNCQYFTQYFGLVNGNTLLSILVFQSIKSKCNIRALMIIIDNILKGASLFKILCNVHDPHQLQQKYYPLTKTFTCYNE